MLEKPTKGTLANHANSPAFSAALSMRSNS